MEEIFNKIVKTIEKTFEGEENTDKLRARVLKLLPIEEESAKIVFVKGTEDCFKAKVIARIEKEDLFINSYCNQNNETLRIHTRNKNSNYYRCKHKTRNEKTKEVSFFHSLDFNDIPHFFAFLHVLNI